MPIYDVYCNKCGKIDEQWLKIDESAGKCPKCGSNETHKMPGGHFKLVYNNKKDVCTWANEGYSSSQYWNAVKSARERGENVKGFGED
ncbi:MAG: FmdB family zinc ribbon protein [Atribacterota bacterium]